jgi:hypothetical protein
MTLIPISPRPPAWDLLAQALTERRPVRALYRGAERTLCPHALGWKNRRAKLLAYQSDGTTSHGPLPTDTHQRWRSMFIDEIETAVLTDQPWQTADNYSLNTNTIDHIELAIQR